MNQLKQAPIPPYYLDYHVTDIEFVSVTGSFGSIVESNRDRSRLLSMRIKVGDYTFDDSHPVNERGIEFHGGRGIGQAILPIENDAVSISFQLWKTAENLYKDGLEQYKAVKNIAERQPKPSTPLDDFSKEPIETYIEPALPKASEVFDDSAWASKIKKYSALFLSDKNIIRGNVSFRLTYERKYFVSSEGTVVVQNTPAVYLNINASIRADDGDLIPLSRSYYATKPTDLPSDEKVSSDIQNLIETLRKLRTAPLAEPYSGPAILMAETSGVFFHEIFGHRIEGHRLKNEYDGQTFKSRINQPVLPKTLNVSFDPTTSSYKHHVLNGSYAYDDEGVKSRKVTVVENGILKTFLMSRSPLENIPNSNGHGRASMGAEPVSRQSNLIVETTKPMKFEALRKMLIKECQKQGKEYGYLFKEVIGGFTTTDRFNPNAFNIFPTEVYRIYVSGKPDELVRGVDLIGTPLAMFAEISAAADDSGVFIGFCGAESGNVPVSAVAPSLFVRRIETQKKPKQHEEATLLSRPVPTEQ
ncbi:MAG TPA: TldD/PmbA family protein [Chryseosolibacter sp.]